MSESYDTADTDRSAGSRIAVVGKSVTVLDVLAERPRGATPSEVAEVLGMNRSTAFRLLTSLELSGLLRRDAHTGRYRLGLKLLRYGESVRRGVGIIRTAEPVMWALEEKLQQTVYLAVRSGWGATCVDRLPGRYIDVMAWKTGGWLPFHVGAGPQAILAALDDDEVERFLASGDERRTRHGEVGADDVRASVAQTRERGWSLNLEALTEGVASLGVAVVDGLGTPICSLSVAGLVRDYRGAALDATAHAVTLAAEQLRRDLVGE